MKRTWGGGRCWRGWRAGWTEGWRGAGAGEDGGRGGLRGGVGQVLAGMAGGVDLFETAYPYIVASHGATRMDDSDG